MPRKRQRKTRESWGRLRKLPSGRWQASYTGPDLALHKALSTFETMTDARAWLTDERRLIERGTWIAPTVRNRATKPATLGAFAEAWLKDRQLKPRSRALYRSLLDQHILPKLGDLPLKEITSLTVRTWYVGLPTEYPTRKAHAYSLLRTILGNAVTEDLIPANPCHIRGAGDSKRIHKIEPASLAELERIIATLPERYRLMILLASWCALRFGELTELRRGDIDVKGGKINVSRGVVWVGGERVVDSPKSEAGRRTVAIPPHLLPVVKQHLSDHAAWGKYGLLFPALVSGHQLSNGSFYPIWDKARRAAGRPDLRFHDLRHTGAVMAAREGATLADLMHRLGHSTAQMAIRYQHAAEDRDAEIARRLSQLANGNSSTS
jgi:integrase